MQKASNVKKREMLKIFFELVESSVLYPKHVGKNRSNLLNQLSSS